jgi:hypothetical protein
MGRCADRLGYTTDCWPLCSDIPSLSSQTSKCRTRPPLPWKIPELTDVQQALVQLSEELSRLLGEVASVTVVPKSPEWQTRRLEIRPRNPCSAPIAAWAEDGSLKIAIGERTERLIDDDIINVARAVISAVVSAGLEERRLALRRRRIRWEPYN